MKSFFIIPLYVPLIRLLKGDSEVWYKVAFIVVISGKINLWTEN